MICLSHTSALELYRASGRLLPELMDMPRTSKLDGCVLPPPAVLDDLLYGTGVTAHPCHLMVGGAFTACKHECIVRHVRRSAMPRGSFVAVSKDILATTPELLFCDLAELDDISEVDLALIGLELCGFYSLDADTSSWTGYAQLAKPITSKAKIERMIDARSAARGIKKARSAACMVLDYSNSPMESIMSILITAPRRLGGLGLSGAKLNYRVETSSGTKYVDLAFPAYNLGIEYKGRIAHSIERAGRDDRRQNKLVGRGMTIFNVWYEDLVQDVLFTQLTSDILGAVGPRVRINVKNFGAKQRLLRAQLIPELRRLSGLGVS